MAETPRFEVPPQMRALAESGVDQARTAFDGVMGMAKRGTEAMRGAGGATAPGADLYARGLDYAEQNVHAALDHARRLSGATSFQEVMQLQAEFLRDRFAAMQAQMADLGGLAQGAVRQGVDQARGMADQARDVMGRRDG